MIRLLIEDELGTLEQILGTVSKKDIKTMTDIAEKYTLKCLRFVDTTGDTYFNEGQLWEIKNNEIKILEQEPAIKPELLDMLQRGLLSGLEESFLFLKFEDLELMT